MSATFEWEILVLECYPQVEDQTNVVTNIHWKCTGTQIVNGKKYIEYIERISTLKPYTKGSSFIPYNDLSEAEACNWIWNAEAYKEKSGVVTIKEATENEIQKILDAKITPPTVFNDLPW